MGVEYGEQEWDTPHRLENAYPNLMLTLQNLWKKI